MEALANNNQHANGPEFSGVQSGKPFTVGSQFEALAFRHTAFDGLMDPLIMADDFTMTGSTFGAHPHAGLSAVSLIFEDSQGDFVNRDSLGNRIELQAGDLYWLHAGSGAVHDEAPAQSAKTHGLQMFVNLPAKDKHSAPHSMHVKAKDIPEIKSDQFRVRVVLGQSCGIRGTQALGKPLTLLDGFLANGSFQHMPLQRSNIWLYCVSGELTLNFEGQSHKLTAGDSIAFQSGDENLPVNLESFGEEQSHFVLVEGEPVNESFVQQGPFAMSTQEELNQCVEKHARGEFGSI